MSKTLLYTKYSYRTFVVGFILCALPFAALKLSGMQLKELPFMFIALLGLAKFFLAKSQDSKNLQGTVKRRLPANVSKQELVNHVGIYKNAQDLALLTNAVIIFLLNITL